MRSLSALGLSAAAFLATIAVPSSSQATDYYMAQVITTAANFCPRGTLEANGKLLPISKNSALFSLLGTMYGGDGRTTFALPDYRPRGEDGEPVPYKTFRYCVVSEGIYPSRS